MTMIFLLQLVSLIHIPFGSIIITGAAVGNTYTANNTHTDFAGTISLLTNGINDSIGRKMIFGGIAGSMGTIETAWLDGPSYENPDFLGHTIDYMELEVLSFTATYDSDKGETTANFSYHVDIFGDTTAVPIPGAAWLLGSGLIGIVGIKRKYRSTTKR